MQVVVEIAAWRHLPPTATPERDEIDAGRADVVLRKTGQRYRADWPGPNFDGVGQMHNRLTARTEPPAALSRHQVFVNIHDRSDVYCLACGALDRHATVAAWRDKYGAGDTGPTAQPTKAVKDVELYYEWHGEGEPLIFISGTGMNCDMWRVFQVPDFSKQYRVLLYDHRGVGRSSKPDLKYSTRMFADDLVQLMNALGVESAHIIGHSMGGRVAQWVALDHPDRVRTLVLSSTGPGRWPGKAEHPLGVPYPVVVEMVEKGFNQYMHDHFNDDFMHSPDFRGTPEWQKVVEAAIGLLPPLRTYLRHVVARQEHQTYELLHRIQVPTLVIVGAKDQVVGGTGDHVTQSRILAERIPTAELKLLEGLHHGYLREAPALANKIILEWLEAQKVGADRSA